MQTVAETRHYITLVEKLLTATERLAVINTVAANPKRGDIIAGTGGIRKFRFAREGKGKSGGVRVVYYYYDENMPILLITLFAKNDKANLSKAERNTLASFVEIIKKEMKG